MPQDTDKEEKPEQESKEPEKICINKEFWDNIPPEIKHLHNNLYKPFWVRTRYGTTEVGILVGARWDLAQLQVLTDETVYDPNVGGYVRRTLVKTIDGKMVVAYGPILREEVEEGP